MKVDRINLHPDARRAPALPPPETVAAAALAMLLILVVALSGRKYFQLRAKEGELARVTRELTTRQVELASVAKTDTKATGPSLHAEIQSKFSSKRPVWSEMLKEVSLLTPDGLWLTEWIGKAEGQEFKVALSADATSQHLISDYFERLEKSYYYRRSKFKYSEQLRPTAPHIYRLAVESSWRVQ